MDLFHLFFNHIAHCYKRSQAKNAANCTQTQDATVNISFSDKIPEKAQNLITRMLLCNVHFTFIFVYILILNNRQSSFREI